MLCPKTARSVFSTYLLVVAGDAAEVAVELVGAFGQAFLVFFLVVQRGQRVIFVLRRLLRLGCVALQALLAQPAGR